MEHEAGRWLKKEELGEAEGLPADWELVETIINEDNVKNYMS